MPASGFTVHRLGETDSTNDWLLAAGRQGAADRTVAVADFQRRGRGRLDRRWEAPRGAALLCSVLLRPALEVTDLHLATVAAGLAALEACDSVGVARAGLKWPNDVVAEDRKLAGILAETESGAGDTAFVVVGLGLNLTWPGPDAATSTSLLELTGRTIERDALLDAYLVALSARDAQLRNAPGRRELLLAYRSRLATLGRDVVVTTHDGTLRGVARDVTDACRLVIETPDGDREVATGDVVHARPASRGLDEAPE